MISLDDLIANKRAVGRSQDRMDVEFLERIRAHKRASVGDVKFRLELNASKLRC